MYDFQLRYCCISDVQCIVDISLEAAVDTPQDPMLDP